MKLNIQRRADGRGFCCIFFHKGQEYFADLTIMPDWETECMIFKSHNGQFSFADALGEYCKCGIDLSPDALRECIEEFISE